MRDPAGVSAADRLRQGAGVDSDRTGRLAHAAGRAGIDFELEKLGAKARQPFLAARALETGDFARADDALTRRHGQAACWAHRLAEAAFDTAVDQRIGRDHWLEILQMDMLGPR